eukprot:4229771-Amphidinium_carterae.1
MRQARVGLRWSACAPPIEAEARQRRAQGCFEHLPLEISQGFLGEDGTYGASRCENPGLGQTPDPPNFKK